jgi:uncharacterized tannase-like protein DUF6351
LTPDLAGPTIAAAGGGDPCADDADPNKPICLTEQECTMMIRCLPARVWLSAAVVAGTGLSGCSDSSNKGNPPADAAVQPDAAIPPDAAPGALQIKTLSNRADLISGGDALVEIVVPPGSPLGALHVTAGATDVSPAFARRADGRTLGVITGLPDNQPTEIKADIGGRQAASLTVTSHPIGGPVFSGAQITPWVCATPLGALPANADDPGSFDSGLSQPPAGAQCNAPTEFKLYYRTTSTSCTFGLPDPAPAKRGDPRPAPPASGCFQPFDPSAPLPANIAMTTTDTNVTVPYIVRVERVTLNRGIGDIAVLFDPSQGTTWNPVAPQTTWNHKMLYVFGPSTNQPRFQLRSTQVWAAQDDALKRGFLVAVNGMTDSFQNSNRVTMSETTMMMKEHIIDSYGELRYAMGAGCSGGSINQLTMASIYPGLLDGIQPSCTFPDSETTGIEVGDCEGLVRVYASDAWKALLAVEGLTAQDAAKQTAINGHLDQIGCRQWFNSFIGVARPGMYHRETVSLTTGTITQAATLINNCGLPESMVYDPNPDNHKTTGARCTAQDHAASVWGVIDDGVHPRHAPSTRDNVGVVYGLKAFQSGAITAEEFVLLNENIGGADFDVNHTTTRSVADSSALATAYRAGIVMDGRQVAKTPIIDVRGFDEQGIHYIWRSFSLRARLDAAGGHGNHVLWRFSGALTPPTSSGLTLASFLAMDKWLTALRADTGSTALQQKIVADKPVDAVDFCYLSFDTGFQFKVTNLALCDLDPGLKTHSSPRQIAGGPVAEDILKCQLKPFIPADYPGLSDAEMTRLQNVFPDGVCDWTKSGVGQQPAVSPLDFTAAPGGVSLPAAPVSHAL